MVKRQKSHTEILEGRFTMLRPILIGWKAVKEIMSWDEYAQKIKPEIRGTISTIFKELRQNGFFNPRVIGDQIIVDYLCFKNGDNKSKQLSVCDLCEDECDRKDIRGVFKHYNGVEVKKCWEG